MTTRSSIYGQDLVPQTVGDSMSYYAIGSSSVELLSRITELVDGISHLSQSDRLVVAPIKIPRGWSMHDCASAILALTETRGYYNNEQSFGD